MNYREVLFATRAACRGWLSLSHGQRIPRTIITSLGSDLLELVNGNESELVDAHSALLLTRPFSTLDCCIYAAIQSARQPLLSRREQIESAAQDAVLYALTDPSISSWYIVTPLDIYSADILAASISYMESRVELSDGSNVFARAKRHLHNAMVSIR